MRLRILLIILSITIMSALIYFSNFNKVVSALSRANLFYIILGISIWPIAAFIRVYRWNYSLEKIGIKVKFSSLFKVYYAGEFISHITPAKTGEVLKNFMLKTSENKKVSSTLPTIIYTRVMDAFAMIFISVLGLYFIFSYMPSMYLWFLTVIIFLSVLIISGFLIVKSDKIFRIILKRLKSIFSFIKIFRPKSRNIEIFINNFLKSFIIFRDGKTFLLIFPISVFIWISEGVILFFAFNSIGVTLPILATIVIIPIASLSGVFSFLPGGIGSSEMAMMIFFNSLFKITYAEVIAAALIFRFLSFWIYMFAGAIFFASIKHKYKL